MICTSLRERGQVLAFFALVLPLVLLPVVAFAVDAAVLGADAAALQAATARAAEVAVEQIDVAAFRAGGGLALDQTGVVSAATQTLLDAEPGASVDSVGIAGTQVTLSVSEHVQPALPLWTGEVTLHARASARLSAGYDWPSSL